MASNFPLEIPRESRVLVTFRVHKNEIPQDKQGRLVIQMYQQGAGSGKPGKIVFGGDANPAHKCTKLSLERLLESGFRINNIQCIVDRKNENLFWVRVWFNHQDEGGLDMQPEHWLEAGEFVRQKLSEAFNRVTVYENKDMFSINMVDHARTPKFILQSSLATKPVAEEAPSTPLTPKAVPTLKIVPVQPSLKSAMQEAFARSGLAK